VYELEDVKVLDLTTGIAGPYCTMLLGDGGAEVIKLEPPTGDSSRGMPPFVNGESATYLALNRNKKSVAIDISSPEGQAVVLELAKQVDIIVEDLGNRETQRLGLDYETIQRLNPQVVYCSISDFGDHGPLADQPGSELVLQAMTEIPASLGVIGEPPLRLGADLGEMNTGLIAFDGALAAYYYRLLHGVGQRVSSNKMVSLLHHRATFWAAQSNPDEWYGFHLDSYVKPPDHGYQAQDLPVYFNLRRGTQESFDSLLLQFGMDEAFGDPRFENGGRDAVGTGRYSHEVKTLWENAFQNFSAEQVVAMVKAADGEAVPVNNLDTLYHHPQMPHFNVLREIEHPTAGTVQVIGEPWQFSNLSQAQLERPPLLGEHTLEVLSGLGYSAADVEALVARGVAR
jgi:crotonobetainyl-CoA:carnitine CoA-transferase CaiB-like acyl-CoA transferase